MKILEAIEKLSTIKACHGNIYVAIRHEAGHEFGPDDVLTDIVSVKYDIDTNTAVIHVRN